MAMSSKGPGWKTRVNHFRNSVKAADELPTTMWITQPWHGVIETLGVVGADAVFIDWEHGPYTIETIERLVMACEAVNVTPVVRAPRVDTWAVEQILDVGAKGVIFPCVGTAEEAVRAVRTTKHAPRGTRGWAGSHNRTAFYVGGLISDQVLHGRETDSVYSREYLERSEDIFVQIMIETIEGVENIDEIAAVEGVDAILFGWGDYSLEVDLDLSQVEAAVKKVYEACRRNGVARAVRPAEAAALAKDVDGDFSGYYLDAGCDTVVIGQALEARIDYAKQAASAALGSDGPGQ